MFNDLQILKWRILPLSGTKRYHLFGRLHLYQPLDFLPRIWTRVVSASLIHSLTFLQQLKKCRNSGNSLNAFDTGRQFRNFQGLADPAKAGILEWGCFPWPPCCEEDRAVNTTKKQCDGECLEAPGLLGRRQPHAIEPMVPGGYTNCRLLSKGRHV